MAVSNQQSRDATLLRAMAEFFVIETRHAPEALRRFEELATHYLGRVGAADRAFVAEKLSRSPDAPAAVLRLLGKDVLEIAHPILKRSPALGEFDLLAVIAATGHAHHRLIAQRPALTPLVVSALRLTGDAEVIARLAPYPDLAAAPSANSRGEAAVDTASSPPAEPAEKMPLATIEASPADQPAADAISGPLSDTAEPAPPTATSSSAEPVPPRHAIAEEPEDGSPAAFLALERDARLAVLRHLAEHSPPRSAESSVIDADQAFRLALSRARLASLARQRRRKALIEALAQGLRLDEDTVAALLDDPSGEPLVVLLRGIGLSIGEAQQVLLFANPIIAQGLASFERLSRLLDETGEEVAGDLIARWRGDQPPRAEKRPISGHQPLFADLPLRRGLPGTAGDAPHGRSEELPQPGVLAPRAG